MRAVVFIKKTSLGPQTSVFDSITEWYAGAILNLDVLRVVKDLASTNKLTGFRKL